MNGELYVSDQGPAITIVNPTTGREITQLTINTSGGSSLVVDLANGDMLSGNLGPPGYVTVINPITNRLYFPTNLGALTALFNIAQASDPVTGNVLFDSYPPSNSSTSVSSPLFLIQGSDFRNVSMNWLPGIIYGAAFDPDNGVLYVSAGYGAGRSISLMSASNLSLITNIRQVPTGPCLFDPANRYLYVAGTGTLSPEPNATRNQEGIVTVINTVTNRVITQVPVGLGPIGIALDSVNGYLYVPNIFSDNVSILSTQTNLVVGSFNVPPMPYGIAYDSLSRSLFIPDFGGDGIYGNANALLEVIPNYPQNTLTFQEQGLPIGANWSVSIDGQVYSAVSPASISIPEFNGSYTFVVTGSQNWTPSPASGTVDLSGISRILPIHFLSPFGSLQGSVQPSTATITLDNQSINVTSTGNFGVDSLTPGIYVVAARAPGFFGVSLALSLLPRNLTTVYIRLIPALPATATQPFLVPWVAGLVGGLVIFGGLMAVGFVVYYRRQRRPPPAP
jgi:YVTN family beta-propeller protein